MIVYVIYDRKDQEIARVTSYIECMSYMGVAAYYRTFNVQNKTTARQKAAVKFIEQQNVATFNGNIENSTQVGQFLSRYLDRAKEVYEDYLMLLAEARAGYEDKDYCDRG